MEVDDKDTISASGKLVGELVFLDEQYYSDKNVTVLEVPRYGWLVKDVVNGVATLEYQRRNLSLLMSLVVDMKYLKRET